MEDQLPAKRDVERIQNTQAQLILRIQQICKEAISAIQSDDPRAIEHHLERLQEYQLMMRMDSEHFLASIAYALEQLGLKPAK